MFHCSHSKQNIRYSPLPTEDLITNLSITAPSFLLLCKDSLHEVFLPTTKGFIAQSHGLYPGNWIMSIEQVLSLKRRIRKWLSFAPITLVLHRAAN